MERSTESNEPFPPEADKKIAISSQFSANPPDSHLFEVYICSEAGKPIYCYNKLRDDEFVVTLMGICQAMMNFFLDAEKDELKSITTCSQLQINFATRTPLIIVVVTHRLSAIDPQLVINQIFAQTVSILTLKTLKTVFEQRPTFDLRRLLGGSEKLLDSLIDEGLLKNPLCLRKRVKFSGYDSDKKWSTVYGYLTSVPTHNVTSKPSLTHSTGSSNPSFHANRRHGSRALIPVLPLIPATRESITNSLQSSVTSTKSDVIFALIFQRRLPPEPSIECSQEQVLQNGEIDLNSILLVTVYNNCPKVAKLHPLDIQLVLTLVVGSTGQLASAESVWMPFCMPRVDSSAFIHGHISYLNQSANTAPSSNVASSSQITEKLVLVLLTAEREDFTKCQHIRDTLCERLNKVRFSPAPFGSISLPQVQMFSYVSIKPQCIIYRSLPFLDLTEFDQMVNYVASRMLTSGYKTFWMQSESHRVVLVGWHSPSFMLYFQADLTMTHGEALTAASNIIKWIKREEEKIKIKDYQ